jgi:transcriptional regulator with XRE-family HTH domain
MLATGSIIKTFREKLGYSQEALAGYLGLKREMISYYETGSRETPLEILEKLATLFGVELDVFFSEHPEDVMAEFAFAFRADNLDEKDLEAIAGFKKIVLNYQRMIKLENKNAKG